MKALFYTLYDWMSPFSSHRDLVSRHRQPDID